jgi:DNA polymerase-3 subunit alpha
MGISILPPDINKSGLKFVPEMWEESQPPESERNRGAEAASTFNAIRYGLAAIKHVGEGAMEMSIAERERAGDFASLEDFCGRLGSRIANRKMLESLVKAGAFDFTGCDRAELFDCIDEALASSAAAHRDRTAGQVSLFDEISAPAMMFRKRSFTPWSEHERMSYEKELLGFYVSGHPLDAYVEALAAKNYRTIGSLGELDDRAQFRVGGAIIQIERKFTRKEGKPFAVVWIEDLTGTLEVVIWNEVYIQVSEMLETGRVVALSGTLDKRDEALRATAQKVKVLTSQNANGLPKSNGESANAKDEPAVLLQFSVGTTSDELREVRQILASSPGPQRVQLVFDRPTGNPLRVDAGADCRINLTHDLEEKLSRWLVSTKTERRETQTVSG